jgi:hypothetical protein
VPPPSQPFVKVDSVRKEQDRHRESKYKDLTDTKHVLFWNVMEMANSGVGLSYLFELWKNRISLHIPFATTFSRPFVHNAVSYNSKMNYVLNYTITRKLYEGGIGLYFNTSPNKSVTHFVGPLVRSALFSGTYDTPRTIDYGYTGPPSNGIDHHTFTLRETYLTLNNGVHFRATSHFNIMLNIALGLVVSKDYVGGDNPLRYKPFYLGPNTLLYGYTVPMPYMCVQTGVHFGFRF